MQPNQMVRAFESVQKHDMTSTLKNQLNIILVEYVPHQNLLVHGSVFLLSMHGYEPYNSTILLLPRTAFVPIQPRRQQSLLHLPNPMQPFCLQNIPPVALATTHALTKFILGSLVKEYVTTLCSNNRTMQFLTMKFSHLQSSAGLLKEKISKVGGITNRL